MAHNHDHHNHSNTIKAEDVNNAFLIGIALNFLFVVVEVVVGIHIHSLSLLSDAGHNLADVASLALSLFAIKMLKIKPTEKYTYGLKKTSVLVALFNAFLLLISIGIIGYEAVSRLIHPVPLPGKIISMVAGIGIVINSVTALLFFKTKENDINVKSAYLHLMSDALVSFGLVIGGIIIFYTNLFWIDALLSMVVVIIILISTWQLLSKSIRLSLDGVPHGVNLEQIKNMVKQNDVVVDFYHIHIWAISTTENALTGHLLLKSLINNVEIEKIKTSIKHELEHVGIKHSTLEIAFEKNNISEAMGCK